MSEIDKLFNNLSEDEIAVYTANHEDEPHIVINADRSITVPPELKEIAVQFDHNIETVTFDCIRYWDGHDLSKMTLYINYKRADNKFGSYIADNVRVDDVDENIIHFEWTFDRSVTEVKGALSFLVCAQDTDEEGYETKHWNSHLNQDLFIREGMDCQASVVDQYPAIITQLLLRMSTVEELPPTVQVTDEKDGRYTVTMTDVKGQSVITLDRGAVFTPTVSEEGDISWTNDRGLPNPPTVRIKGPKGEQGDVINLLTAGSIKVAIGSTAAWNTYTGDKTDVLFIPTDVPTISAYLDGIQNAYRKDDVAMFAKTKGIMAGIPTEATVVSRSTFIGTTCTLRRAGSSPNFTQYNIVGYNGVLGYITSCDTTSEYQEITLDVPDGTSWDSLSAGDVITVNCYTSMPVHKAVEATCVKKGRAIEIPSDKPNIAPITKPGLYAFVIHMDSGDAQNYSGCISIPDVNSEIEHTIMRYQTTSGFSDVYVRVMDRSLDGSTNLVRALVCNAIYKPTGGSVENHNAYFTDVRLIAEY